jgi:hypothetical protein
LAWLPGFAFIQYRGRPELPGVNLWNTIYVGRDTDGGASRFVFQVLVLYFRWRRDILQFDKGFSGMVWQFARSVPRRVLRDDFNDHTLWVRM